MTLLHIAVEDKKLDVRVIEKNLAAGAVSSADIEKSLQKLPDDSENAEWVSTESFLGEGSSKDKA